MSAFFGDLPVRVREFYRERVRKKGRFRQSYPFVDTSTLAWEARKEYESDPEAHLKWDRRFLKQSMQNALEFSKDPSTRVGAVIVDTDRSFVSQGYNGFAMGVRDDPELYADRDLKLLKVVHAEINAIVFARRDLRGCTLYTWPFMPCGPCSGVIIQAGIVRVVAPPTPPDKADRWASSFTVAVEQFKEAGVELSIVDMAEDTAIG